MEKGARMEQTVKEIPDAETNIRDRMRPDGS